MEDAGVYGRRGMVGERPRKEIGVFAVRAGDVVGEHTLIFGGIGERFRDHAPGPQPRHVRPRRRAGRRVGPRQAAGALRYGRRPRHREMRIARYEFEGRARYGLADPESGTVREIAGDPFDRVEATGKTRRLEEVRLLAPVVPGKIVAVGLNYRDHAREMGKTIPEEPLLFLKAPSALNDPGGEIVYRRSRSAWITRPSSRW